MKTNPSLRRFQPAVATTLAIVIACGLSVRPAQAVPYVVTLQQVGSNVVATGTGAFNLTGLSFLATTIGNLPQINGTLIETGQTGGFGQSADVYSGLTGPASFGGLVDTLANSGSGSFVGINANALRLLVPSGYVSGTALSDSATYNNATLSSLGVTPGIYEWTWGTGANQNFTLDAVAPAVPDSGSTFGLLAMALTALVGLTRFRSSCLA